MPITDIADFEKYFPGVDWVPLGRLGLTFYSFFAVVFLMVWLCQCLSYFYFSSSEYTLWLFTIMIPHIHHASSLTCQHSMSKPHWSLKKLFEMIELYQIYLTIYSRHLAAQCLRINMNEHSILSVHNVNLLTWNR